MADWKFNEILLLVDTYNKIAFSKGFFPSSSEFDRFYEKEVQSISNLLRNLALQQGKIIDDDYRNLDEIRIELKRIEYLASNGESGLGTYSVLDKKGYDYSKNNPKEFSRIVDALKMAVELRNAGEEKKDSEEKAQFQREPTISAVNGIRKDQIGLPLDTNDSDQIEEHQKTVEEPITLDDNGAAEDGGSKVEDQATSNLQDDLIPLFSIYGIDPVQFRENKVTDTLFSVRVFNCLMQKKILTIEDLLRMSKSDLRQIRSFGKKCEDEIDQFCFKLIDAPQASSNPDSCVKIQEGVEGDLWNQDESGTNECEGSTGANQTSGELADDLVPLFLLYGIDPSIFREDKITNTLFSVRVFNCLEQKNILTIEDLLRMSKSDLRQIRSFGKKCEDEMEQFCLKLIGDTPFYLRYGLEVELYGDVILDENVLSNRALNALKRMSVFSMGQLLLLRPSDLRKGRNVGEKTITEIQNYLSKQASKNKKPHTGHQSTNIQPSRDLSRLLNTLREHSDSIALSDFSFANQVELNEEEKMALTNYQEACSLLGEELTFECFANADYIFELTEVFQRFDEENRIYENRLQTLRLLVEALPEGRANLDAYYFVFAFTTNKDKRNKLLKVCPKPEISFWDIIRTNAIVEQDMFLVLKSFIEFCSFNITEEINALLERMYYRPEVRIVLENRVAKQTLETVGNLIGVTRERVRQIEAKAKRTFYYWYGRHQIIFKIAAILQDEVALSPVELEEFFGENTEVLVYLLKSVNGFGFGYDNQSDLFYLGDNNTGDQIQAAIESLPDIIVKGKLKSVIAKTSEATGVSASILEKTIHESYNLTGETYHRVHLTLARIYEDIFRKYYSAGIYIYDPGEIARFRSLVYQTYGNVNLPENDRAIAARLASIGILCGRGKYMPKRKTYIPPDLAERILTYISDSEQKIFMTNTIFNVFEDDLAACGIDNKYYLQGVLRELYEDRFIFRRDYISKDSSSTNLYMSIVKFIKQSDYPVSKAEIYKAFPGVTEIVVTIAVNDPDVINYFGKYIHSSKLRLSMHDKEYLTTIVKETLEDGNSHHCSEIYERIEKENAELLERYGIYMSYSLFSVLQFLLQESYQFDRPYIAPQGVQIDRAGDKLREKIRESDEIAIADIISFAKENRVTIISLLDYFASFEQTHLMRDYETLMTISLIGINEGIAKEMEKVIEGEIKGPMLIAHLQCANKLPEINVPWNEWLIYSVLRRWGTVLEVGTTSPQYRYAMPVVGKKGTLDRETLDSFSKTEKDTMLQPDNLDNIDDLISDIILEE